MTTLTSEKFPQLPFWKTKHLAQMTPEEWEALCDGCGRCCLHKIDDENGRVLFTNVACRLLDLNTCTCKHYRRRMDIISDCLLLTADKVEEITWLPKSCAYRRIAEGKGLAWWHPLVSGDRDSVQMAGISVCGKVISEVEVDLYLLYDHQIDWID